MNIEQMKQNSLVLLECISGSRAYGLQTPQSDTDIKGVFVLPQRLFYGLNETKQLSNESNDQVYYELKRFIELLAENNPNLLELLNSPADCILQKHALMDLIKPELFLSRLCKQSFAGYAQSQIKKARGLNKKIVNPLDKERKSPFDFCYVLKGQGSMNLERWLHEQAYRQEDCGLVNIAHLKDAYYLFHRSQHPETFFRGIFSGPEAQDVSLSSVPKGIEPLAVMSFNKDGYSKYCKDYKNYWEWVELRNEARYENTISHGKNYDAKNMMHTFRLLNMAEEIALEKKINVRRTDREFLLKVRSGAFEYDDLVNMAGVKLERVEEAFAKSDLPEEPDMKKIEELLVELRMKCYGE